jgi:hypothetical protein
MVVLESSKTSPFGEADCEAELGTLHDRYSELYFDESPFNEHAIESETYLIIGRRGSGKTALAQYFSFQQVLPNAIYIGVDEPAVYQQVLSDVAVRSSHSREISIPKLEKVWEYVLWSVIFEHIRVHSPIVAAACSDSRHQGGASGLVNSVIKRLHSFLKEEGRELDEQLTLLLTEDKAKVAREEAMKLARRTPIIVVLDTLERYDTSDEALMNALAALIQCAARFNIEYSRHGIHLKVLMSGEVFPYLQESVLQNPLKSVKNEVHLFWRPRDLLRLISWRFHRYLESQGQLNAKSKRNIDWTSHKEVLKEMWTPYFGQSVRNRQGFDEDTFYYLLRHTQMRPRQLILLCNSVAKLALHDKVFPLMSEQHIREGVRRREEDLALEVINSFSSLYPNVARIVDALIGLPMTFRGNELAKCAPKSAPAWQIRRYSPESFFSLVSELGIVGRVKKRSGSVVEGEFEYSLKRRLGLSPDDDCVIHPMFYSRLDVRVDEGIRVMPFYTDPDR